jgi:DNA-binding FadR family transcriptional regulator
MALTEEEPLPFQATQRTHVADGVFDQIAAAILRGELPAGSALPPERVLADRFQTSRIIARQAIHRLAEVGLVRVRQGGATLVLDPNEAADLRILELFYRLAPSDGGGIDARQTVERQLLQGLCLIEVASRCGCRADLEAIEAMASALAAETLDEEGYRAFEERFWRAVAAAGGSRIFRMEVAWWYRVLPGAPRMDRYAASPLEARVAFYRELARRLARGRAPVAFYLRSIGPLLSALRRRPEESAPPGRRKTQRMGSR